MHSVSLSVVGMCAQVLLCLGFRYCYIHTDTHARTCAHIHTLVTCVMMPAKSKIANHYISKPNITMQILHHKLPKPDYNINCNTVVTSSVC